MASDINRHEFHSGERSQHMEKRRLSESCDGGIGRDERKIGHRRVHENGSVTYKKRPTTELMAAIQLGIGQSVGGLSSKPSRDILYEDFHVVVTVNFPKDGSSLTPAHHCNDFRFRTYAPDVFRYFRELFKIKPEDFLLSLCNEPLRELPNPGASGSIFYVTNSDEFIIKTVQHKEAEFLQKLLPGYYMNLNQNPCTLLPKFYGLFCYQCGGKNIRFVVMNNILSSDIVLSEKFDLKGSTYKRKASKNEKSKPVPTLKDLDFAEIYPDGIILEPETYDAIVRTLDRDCRVLESFKIMDYSLLMGVHNLDSPSTSIIYGQSSPLETDPYAYQVTADEMKTIKPRIGQYSTPMESIQGGGSDISPGQIPGRNSKGERLLLYVGIIDILQNYRLAKKLEHAFKSIVRDGDTVSVHHPQFYSKRFRKFFCEVVFKTSRPNAKRKSLAGRKSIVPNDADRPAGRFLTKRPDLLPHNLAMKPASSYNNITSMNKFAESKNRSENQLFLSQTHISTFSSHLSVASLESTGTSTPTNTQHTGATMSYTDSSPSLSTEHLLNDGVFSSCTLTSVTKKLHQLNISTDQKPPTYPCIEKEDHVTHL